ncbi:MAG: GNAT family N-acetyltransferase [Syntrophobacteraceae bacterium]|jgi:L-amino acid N-acyltransferase YncA|nr:GNAT family N-acetyltransferase [Syntrophobacteraceae bacterium]
MPDQETEVYEPRSSVLVNGEMVHFRCLRASDEELLRSFFLSIPETEAANLRHDIRSPEVVSSWVHSLDFKRVFPLMAMDEELQNIIAVSSLHFQKGVYRHIAEIRIVVGKAYRKLGLGSALIKELIEVANRLGLHFLKAEVPMENQLAIRAFRQLGFEVKCTLERYYMTRSGDTKDIVLMIKRLLVELEEDLFFVF